MLFDTHVHLDAPSLRQDLQDLLLKARSAGVRQFLIPGVFPENWAALVETANSIRGAFAAPGLHPMASDLWNEETASLLIDQLKSPAAVAVGEIGLDALIETPTMEVQERAFRDQIRIARNLNLPIVIHCRRATGRLLQILKEEQAETVGGIFHGFSGSYETAMEGIRVGFAIGFGGPLTYPNARRTPEVLHRLPQEWIVLETDAPDLAPHPHRGELNTPANLPLIARKVSEIRGWTQEKTALITTKNAQRILKQNL